MRGLRISPSSLVCNYRSYDNTHGVTRIPVAVSFLMWFTSTVLGKLHRTCGKLNYQTSDDASLHQSYQKNNVAS